MGQTERERFKHAVIIEEAHHILLRKKQEVTGEETVTDVLLREIRELGECIICLDQHPSLISKPALGNTYTTFAMNLKHRGDIAMIKDCLLLDSEQSGYLGKLEVGWAVAKLQGRWFKPFLVKFPLVTLDKGSATDDSIRRHMKSVDEEWKGLTKRYKGGSGVISVQEGSSRGSGAQRKGIPAIPVSGKRGKQKKECAISLTTKERKLLEDVVKHPTSSITERYRRLALSSRIGNRIHHSLLSKGVLSFEFVSFDKGRIKVLCLTRKGREVLGYDAVRSTRHGGIEHQYWKEKVAAKLRECGYTVREEYPIGNGRTVDLVAQKDGKRIAIEIETGKSDAVANIRKCLDAGFEMVVSVATTDAVKDAIAQRVGAFGKNKTRVKIINPRELAGGGALSSCLE